MELLKGIEMVTAQREPYPSVATQMLGLTDVVFQSSADFCVERCCQLGSLVLAFPRTRVARLVDLFFKGCLTGGFCVGMC